MSAFNHRPIQVLADQAVFSGTNFLLTIFIAKRLSISDFGAYSAYMLFLYLVVSAISSWTTQVGQVARERTAVYVSFVFWLHVFLALSCVSVCILVQVYSSVEVSNAVLWFGFGFVLYDFGRKQLLSDDRIAATLFLDAVTSFSVMVAFLSFIHGGTKELDQMMALMGSAFTISLFTIMALIKPFYFHKKQYAAFLKSHIRQGRWLFYTALSQWWAGNLFVVASGLYLGGAALGALRLGQSLMGILNILLQAFENYVLPLTAQKMNREIKAGLGYIRDMNKKLIYVFIPVLVAFFGFAGPIMSVAGSPEYGQYAFILQGLSILYLLILLSQPLRFALRSLHLNNHFFYGYFISLGYALLASHWLISAYGLYGVLAGLMGAQIILIAYWTLVLHHKNIRIWKSFISF